MAHSQALEAPANDASNQLHVLALTPFYPVAGDDARGCFVAEPLPLLEGINISSTVLAVRPFYRGHVCPHPVVHVASWRSFPAIPGGLGLPTSGAFLFSTILSRIREIHRLRPLHVIHAHAALPCGHAAALLSQKLGIPFVVTVHGLDAFFTNQVRGLSGQWCKRVCQRVYREAGQVVCISEKVREAVLAGGSAKTAVIYNGVDAEMFTPSRRAEISPVILSVGNLIPIKGHALLLRGFAAVHREFPEVTCELIGDGPELPKLRRLTSELDIASKVQFRGRQDRHQVADVMRRCMLFALPSRYEGLGCVYLEAMASGKPAIACRGQAIEEIIQHGRNGWLIGSEDVSEMARALRQLLKDPELRNQVGAAARNTILERFTLAHQAQRMAQLYRGSLS